jgi:OmpA-OmpF porin, OOP family
MGADMSVCHEAGQALHKEFEMAHAGRNVSWMAWLGLAAVVVLGGQAFHRGEAQPGRLVADVEARASLALADAGFGWTRLSVKDAVGELQGEAPSEDARAAALDAARGALAPFMGIPGVFAELDNRIRVRALPVVEPAPVAAAAASAPPLPASIGAIEPMAPPRACVDGVNAAMRSAAIRFKPRSADLPPTARPALRRLTQLIGRCDGWRLVIEGHPDRNATRAVSRRLMQRRAVAVASALLLDGVPVDRLALQTDDGRLRTPGSDPRAGVLEDRVNFHLVPQGAILE